MDRPDQIDGVVRAPYPRVWFLEHDGDPVVRFRPRLLARRGPATRPRGRNIPPHMVWVPGLTWLTTLVDTLFATDVRPGDFQSKGARLPRGPRGRGAGGLPPAGGHRGTAQRLEAELRRAEVERAALIERPAEASGGSIADRDSPHEVEGRPTERGWTPDRRTMGVRPRRGDPRACPSDPPPEGPFLPMANNMSFDRP